MQVLLNTQFKKLMQVLLNTQFKKVMQVLLNTQFKKDLHFTCKGFSLQHYFS